jgi:E3 ubiquitin-protein ligase SHPRH
VSSSPKSDDEFSPDDERFPKTKLGEELQARNLALQQRMRECQVTRHKIAFLCGDIYNVLGNIEAERLAYEQADELRNQLLHGM